MLLPNTMRLLIGHALDLPGPGMRRRRATRSCLALTCPTGRQLLSACSLLRRVQSAAAHAHPPTSPLPCKAFAANAAAQALRTHCGGLRVGVSGPTLAGTLLSAFLGADVACTQLTSRRTEREYKGETRRT